MLEATKVKLNQYVQAVAKKYGVADATEKFSVDPTATQRIVAQMRESNWFLGRINIVPVLNQKGEALGLGVTGMIAGRTDTTADKIRKTKSVHNLKPMPYLCEQTNFDTHIRYSQLDAFAHLKNFAAIIATQTREQIDANKVTIGFYGTSCVPNTDATTNPNGEDVCKGWFQALREHNTGAMMKEGKVLGEIRIGEGGDFINLDLAVMNVKQLLSDPCINAPDLIAIIGSDLLANEKAKFYAKQGNTPSEKSKIEELQVIGTYGGLPAVSVPGFPPSGILVTSYKNLSIYIQSGSIRRAVGKKNDERDQVENFESMNMAYVIEELGKAAAVEFDNVKILIDGKWV
ncbi:phage major capsid protein, P2 family [Shewanella sp. D64]|uniref:phage major capsid protein, P2 family n=1 Tax=unclassified Shewanella TaxID=196818 RepID=UPI0022BA53FC|nr:MULTISPECIES: phage major capsid protein, P2 family [unclassified Shewanella]MEC4729004.1 phage major capsid protein, P2 family [Shewanella sp. D64]MEC4740030.1 phage major capsid protein, P2 family [Shewanella sp. E94]WBJ94386.1 phage major capsid protein, P2 family [Shewanella sp. MTB7]